MLRFQYAPDTLIHQIISEAIKSTIIELEESIEDCEIPANPDISEDYNQTILEPEIITAFGGGKEGIELIIKQYKRLLKAHKDRYALYMPTDRLFKLLHRALEDYIAVYNDLSCDMKPDGLHKTANKEPVYEIDFEYILGNLFWDTDYDMPELENSPPEVRRMMGLSEDAVRASANQLVDASDLILSRHTVYEKPIRLQRTNTPAWELDDAEFSLEDISL